MTASTRSAPSASTATHARYAESTPPLKPMSTDPRLAKPRGQSRLGLAIVRGRRFDVGTIDFDGARLRHAGEVSPRCRRPAPARPLLARPCDVLSRRRTRVGDQLALDAAQSTRVLLVRAELRGRGSEMNAPHTNDAAEHFAARGRHSQSPSSVVAVPDWRDEVARRELVYCTRNMRRIDRVRGASIAGSMPGCCSSRTSNHAAAGERLTPASSTIFWM